MKYELALRYATEVKSILSPFCERVEIAGGVRRHKAEPHDIEIVAKPKMGAAQDFSLGFGNFEVNQLDQEIRHRLAFDYENGFKKGEPDKTGKKAPCGPKYYRLKYKGEKLDIFAVIEPAQWGTIFLIRTGDADFSREFVIRLWKYNLKSVNGHIENGKAETIPTPEEVDAFKLCQMNYVEPEKRTIEIFKEMKT